MSPSACVENLMSARGEGGIFCQKLTEADRGGSKLTKFWLTSFVDDPDVGICDIGRENIPLVTEGEAEQITIFHRSVINYPFLDLIGFYHFKVFSID